MNPTYLSAPPIRPHRRPDSNSTVTLNLPRYSSYNDAPNAPQGLVSQARDDLHSYSRQNASSAPRRAAAFAELTVNGTNTFNRINSPNRRPRAAVHIVRQAESQSLSNTENTTTHLDLPRAPSAIRRRPVSAILADRLAAQAAREKEASVGRREGRRRTIYVPDDTTVMTIHPGSSSSQQDDTYGGSETIALAKQKPLRRGSISLQKPRRRSSVAPGIGDVEGLTVSLEQMDMVLEEEDAGQTQPKQSVDLSRRPKRKSMAFTAVKQRALGMSFDLGTVGEDETVDILSKPAPEPQKTRQANGRKALGAVSTNRRMSHAVPRRGEKIMVKPVKEPVPYRKPAIRKSFLASHARSNADESVMYVVGEPAKPKPVPDTEPASQSSIHQSQSQSNRNKKVTFLNHSTALNTQFAVFQDDLAHPELYEENWLEHQEIAMTQLINAFFDATNPKRGETIPLNTMRSSFIKLYNDPEMAHLNKRLQASLMYGSLTVPKELLARSIRLKDDVGQRRTFLDTFMEVYDLKALQAAAEAITGREVVQSRTSTQSKSELHTADHSDKKSIERYIDLFFMQHNDVNLTKAGNNTITALARDKNEQAGSPIWSWRRTVIRSLMLVLVLDMAKSKGLISGCLFQSSSPHKSSEDVVKALGALLLPSYGDLMRPLKHLKYEVSISQQSLEEYSYHVENLATDLRDGVRLTRIVEILLGANHAASISSANSSALWTLSQHLKYPCPSRTHKLQNAMVAVSAMVRLSSMPEKLLKDISAFDIVDGHREKTLSLLWAMLGQYSMETLIDWPLLKRETAAAHTTLRKSNTLDETMDDISALEPTSRSACYHMLFQWSKATAALHSFRIANLTTSFAGPGALSAILAEYTRYLGVTSPSTDLPAGLRAVGCSTAFSALLSGPQTVIPTRDFTLTALTFLAARLLPAARGHRAACVIQGAYRHVLKRREIHRRINLMRLANHCAAVVNARDRVIAAATVLQRAWRRVLDGKIRALEKDVTVFQAAARGWLVRSAKERKKGGVRRAGW
ncbi:hypothetical protein BT63DRAFT_327699 [Microthyrium microscopicum]|uniref:Calponin-homology (CH) domain-containing protein n=1 Tax=Microthyrium microscopicum TaxID=703497 RepID=A0A6A6U6I1_9PEZI|nr:hypothetical protein BT63DRAFT_327699 [Microthyrium microscopicum]